MRREWFAAAYEQVVNKHVEFSLRDQLRIELPDCARRCVSWIRKTRLASLFAFCIRASKYVERDEHLAANFERTIDLFRLRFEAQRHAANRSRILRNVFADTAVAARDGAS